MIWKSVVGKLWATILGLVSIVLFILSLLLMQFFRNYIVEDVSRTLTTTADQFASILEDSEDVDSGLEVLGKLTDEMTNIIVILDGKVIHRIPEKETKQFSVDYFLDDPELSGVLKDGKDVVKDIELSDEEHHALMAGAPFVKDGKRGAVFVYQPLEAMNDTTIATTKIIWLGAFIAFVMTTVFAFFLSTRIGAPLRKMRQVAFEVVRGKFDTKVPILTSDEIGELAIAINEMRKQLNINMNALKQEKELLFNILSSMADGVLTFNRAGKILVSNPPAEEFLFLFREEEHQEQDVPSKIMNLFSEVMETGKEQTIDIVKNNRYWTVIVSPLYNDDGDIRGGVAVLRDMTEERKLDKMRTDFVANVSHELRTPISMLQGYSEALMDDVASSEEERKEISKVIYEESLRMGRLVNELLDLAKMESGAVRLSMAEVPIRPFLDRIARKFSGMAKENGVELVVESEEGLVPMDSDRIEQVLTNLIDNAIRHTSEGGTIHVRSWFKPPELFMEVSDNGSGIPPEDLPYIFERFYKADKARTRGRSGTGLGLAIAKNIVEAHHGTISVESEVGKGTTFIVRLPLGKMK
jgi:PAS/PAC sensor signal transduction histidine kinase (EC 2.7.13.3)